MDVLGTKTRLEREDEEAERLVRPLPKLKPPRKDRRREEMWTERDPDVEGDEDLKGDPDMSLNRREIGGSANVFRGLVQRALYSSYPLEDLQMGAPQSPNDPLHRAVRTAIYHGLKPEGVSPYPGWEQAHICDLGSEDFSTILATAREWLRSPVLSKAIGGMIPDSRFRAALDLAIRETEDGKYSSAINSNLYNMLLGKLAGESSAETLLTLHEASFNPSEGTDMAIKFAKEDANAILGRLDKLAHEIQSNFKNWGIPFEEAKGLVQGIDRVADDIEKAAFGEESLKDRQVRVLKDAKVLQKDADEGYMDTYNAPMAPKQTDADEPYMSLFKDDQSSAVNDGKSTTGRPLAP
jgi:hypothetical protein